MFIHTCVHGHEYTHMYGDYTLPLDATPQDAIHVHCLRQSVLELTNSTPLADEGAL